MKYTLSPSESVVARNSDNVKLAEKLYKGAMLYRWE